MQWRPVAYVALRDETLRRQLSDALHGQGWLVIAVPTGYHLVESMADALLGQHPWLKPALVVAEALSPGCSGMTIAQGLRDLGWTVPIVLVAHSDRERRLLRDIDARGVHVLDAERATDGVLEIARARHHGAREASRRPGHSSSPAAGERSESN